MDKRKIADLLFPNLKWTTEEIEAKYQPRNLNDTQVVSRYAPSPTGYMHVGNFFQMFISYNLTRVTDGRFFLRIEDTDSKREKKDATKVIYEILSRFGIKFNEYQTLEGEDIGDYGPYVQSQRVDIYKAYAKKLVEDGKAFPCFCKKTEGKEDILKLGELNFPVLSDKASTQMMEIINDVSKDGDSVGGVLETLVLGMPKGVGEPWFDSLESVLSHALFSIPAVKGVEFGLGFGFADLNGELANDQFILDNGEIKTQTNNNGGINGGISNGMPIKFRSVVKPTPSIYKEQKTVNMNTMTEQTLQIKGRHDPAIIHRARVVVDSLTAFVLADMLCVKYGTDYLTK